MATAPTAPPSVLLLSKIPNRATDSPSEFSNNADTAMSEINTMGTSQNTLVAWQEDTAQEVYDNALEAEQSAVDSAASAADSLQYSQNSASSANYVGEWADQTGAANKPYSTSNNGATYGLVNNLADVTLSEPSPNNADWFFISGTRWLSYTSSFTVNRNSINYILATSSATDITQPTFTAKDFAVFKNSVDSTQTVRVLNPSNTLTCTKGTVSAGDNLVLAPGDVVHFVARTSTILEEV